MTEQQLSGLLGLPRFSSPTRKGNFRPLTPICDFFFNGQKVLPFCSWIIWVLVISYDFLSQETLIFLPLNEHSLPPPAPPLITALNHRNLLYEPLLDNFFRTFAHNCFNPVGIFYSHMHANDENMTNEKFLFYIWNLDELQLVDIVVWVECLSVNLGTDLWTSAEKSKGGQLFVLKCCWIETNWIHFSFIKGIWGRPKPQKLLKSFTNLRLKTAK